MIFSYAWIVHGYCANIPNPKKEGGYQVLKCGETTQLLNHLFQILYFQLLLQYPHLFS